MVIRWINIMLGNWPVASRRLLTVPILNDFVLIVFIFKSPSSIRSQSLVSHFASCIWQLHCHFSNSEFICFWFVKMRSSVSKQSVFFIVLSNLLSGVRHQSTYNSKFIDLFNLPNVCSYGNAWVCSHIFFDITPFGA